MTGSALTQTLPHPAAQQALQQCSLKAGSWMVHQATEQGSVQWDLQGLGLQPFSPSAMGDGSRGQGAFPVSTHSLARDIMPLLFQTTREKEIPNPKLNSMGLGRENKSCKESECKCLNISSSTWLGLDEPQGTLPSQDILCSIMLSPL